MVSSELARRATTSCVSDDVDRKVIAAVERCGPRASKVATRRELSVVGLSVVEALADRRDASASSPLSRTSPNQLSTTPSPPRRSAAS